MIRWLKFWVPSKDGTDTATALKEAEQRLAEAKRLAAAAQPTVQQGAAMWRRNHLGEAAAAALQHYGSRP
jgi:hypothetical protein